MIFTYNFDNYDYDYEVDNDIVKNNLESYFGISYLADIYAKKVFDTLTQSEVDDWSEYFGIIVNKDNIAELIEADDDYDSFLDEIIDNEYEAFEPVFEELADIFEDEAEAEFYDEDWEDQEEAEKEWTRDYYKSRF